METPSQHPESAPLQPAAPAYDPPQSSQYAPQAAPKKRMSAGAKWAIGLGIGFVVLTLFSCVVTVALLGSDTGSFGVGDSVALIHISDVIQGSSGGSGDPEYVLDQIDQALEDDSVKAIVLRIDSPGGTVAASQEITLAVRRAAEEKPIVTSVGDICASGAYMVAAQTDEIIASPGSTVGSIGVIMEVANIEELLSKVGVSFTTLTYGEYKDAGSMYRSLTETETAMLNEELATIGDQFIADVAEGRGMDEDEVRELATGWAWVGSEALELGLIDSLGNYDDAIDRAAELGGIEGDPYIVSYEYVDPFAGLYDDLLGIISEANDFDAESLQRIALPR
ncbi:MAG: signal peptide peptidase SppA [Coriobacteriia bacterium]|nr:signal peptide peptidase SppA [Coriobacteriia bacterium]